MIEIASQQPFSKWRLKMDRILSTKHEWDPHTHFRACHEISNKLQHEVVGARLNKFFFGKYQIYFNMLKRYSNANLQHNNCENKTKIVK